MPDEEETNPLPVPQFSGGSDPFSLPNGIFVENLRDSSEDDDLDELRASMQQMGWDERLPAIRDERGVVLAGHRRLKVAAELGIEPVWLDVRLGVGEAADAERLKIALASNIGFKPMTPTSRKRIAAYLYGDVGWSMEKIGGALRVNKATISRDLGENGVVADATTPRASKRGVIGEGRPRKPTAEPTPVPRQQPAGAPPLTTTATKPEPAPEAETGSAPSAPAAPRATNDTLGVERRNVEAYIHDIEEHWNDYNADNITACREGIAALRATLDRLEALLDHGPRTVADPPPPPSRPQLNRRFDSADADDDA